MHHIVIITLCVLNVSVIILFIYTFLILIVRVTCCTICFFAFLFNIINMFSIFNLQKKKTSNNNNCEAHLTVKNDQNVMVDVDYPDIKSSSVVDLQNCSSKPTDLGDINSGPVRPQLQV